jgi:hypothetical protein
LIISLLIIGVFSNHIREATLAALGTIFFLSILWQPAVSGNYKIVVRATDKTGKVQTAEVRPPFPDGNTGYPVINI